MLKKTILVISLVLVSNAGYAQQQQPDPAFMQRAINALQKQRNIAMDNQAIAEAKVDELGANLAKAQEKIKELEAKSSSEKEPAKK